MAAGQEETLVSTKAAQRDEGPATFAVDVHVDLDLADGGVAPERGSELRVVGVDPAEPDSAAVLDRRAWLDFDPQRSPQRRVVSAGRRVRDGKATQVLIKVTGKRMRAELKDNLLFSGPITESSIEAFVEKYWFWKKRT